MSKGKHCAKVKDLSGRRVQRLTFLRVLSGFFFFQASLFKTRFRSGADGRRNILTISVPKCNGVSKLKSVFINTSDYTSGKERPTSTQTHTAFSNQYRATSINISEEADVLLFIFISKYTLKIV